MNRKIIEKNLKEMNLSRSYLERNFVTPLTTTLTTTTTNNKQITNTTKFMKINTNTFHEHIYANLKLKALMNGTSASSVTSANQVNQQVTAALTNNVSNKTCLVKHQSNNSSEISDIQLNTYRKISNFETSDPSPNSDLDNNRIRRIFSNLKKLQFNYDNLANKSESFNGLSNLQDNYLDCISSKATQQLSEQLRFDNGQQFLKQQQQQLQLQPVEHQQLQHLQQQQQQHAFDYICYAAAATTQQATTTTTETIESAETENDCERNELDETVESDDDRLEEAIEKINLNESKFDSQLLKIEEKLKEIHLNFERRSNKTLEKLDSYDVKMAEFQNDFYTQLDKIEDIIEEKIEDRMREMNTSFEKRFEEFAEKLNSTLQIYLNSLAQ